MWSLDQILHFSTSRTILVLGIVAILGGIDLWKRAQGRNSPVLWGCMVGSLLSLAILSLNHAMMSGQLRQSPYLIALGVIVLCVCWKMLFGPWDAKAKVTMLGTFLFWVAFDILATESAQIRQIHLMAIGIGLIPAVLWCLLFLKYHRERMTTVLLMFFSGMLSTVPILFYDMLVRRGIELQFFLFRITPESFSSSSQSFVSSAVVGIGGLHSALLTSLVSFLIVGIIEEVSKYWVLRKSGTPLFTSIDDAIEMAVIVAIGFAFAENIINPSYFGGFIQEYLLGPNPDFLAFLTNILGRSVLTSMVHILSTGIIGYALGLAIFAPSYLAEEKSLGRHYPFLKFFHRVLQVREVSVFRFRVMVIGLVVAIVLHALFNFLVTFPDLLPGRPQTVAELFGFAKAGILGHIPLLLLPSLLYVVGGFWFLTSLFMRRENREERGHPMQTEILVKG